MSKRYGSPTVHGLYEYRTACGLGARSKTCRTSRSGPVVSPLRCAVSGQKFQPCPVFIRFFSRTWITTTAEQSPSTSSSPGPIDELLSTIRSTKRERSPSSHIRQSLRAWGVQNERVKQEQGPDLASVRGNLTRLPNAMFIRDQREGEKEDGAGYDNYEYPERSHTSIDEADLSPEDESFRSRSGYLMTPGTLIQYESNIVKRQDSVYVGELGSQSLLLLRDGQWAAVKMRMERFSTSVTRLAKIPEFLSPAEVARLRAYMPKEDVKQALVEGADPIPVDATGSLPETVFAFALSKFRALENAEQRFIREHQSKLTSMYESLSWKERWRTINMTDLSFMVLGLRYNDLTNAARRAFIRFATRCHPLIVPTQTAETITFCIGPKSLNDDIASVQEWARQYQEAASHAALGRDVSELLTSNPLSSFIDKARRIIVRSRKLRAPMMTTGIIGPAMNQGDGKLPQKIMTGETFTANDRRILSYLRDIAIRRPLSHVPSTYASLIVRAIGAYPTMELDFRSFRLLLQELGCIDPWTSFEDLSVPLSGMKTSWELDQLEHEAMKSILPVIDSRNDTTLLADSMAHMRKDWGDMEVICIDKSLSKNIEDALSIEPASELDGGHWFHIHVAHPTAHFDADHPLSRLARKKGTSFYSLIQGESMHTMLPRSVTRQFSLQSGSPVLTISTLISTSGCVHKVDVVPGIIRNVKQVDRDAVQQLFGSEEESGGPLLTVGPGLESSFSNAVPENVLAYTRGFMPKLSLINGLLISRREQRTRETETPAQFRRLGLPSYARVTLPEGHKRGEEYESYHWKGDPGITVQGVTKLDLDSTYAQLRASDITAQAMRLAAESLGRWFAERQIPAVFLTNEFPAGTTVQKFNEMSARGEVSAPPIIRVASSAPFVMHHMKQYAGCTSPLRKYIDMLAHFQVDSYLKAEAQGLVATGTPVKDDSVLAFSRRDVENYLACDAGAIDAVEAHLRSAKKRWLVRALFRAFHSKQAALPEVMEMVVTNPGQRNILGELGSPAGVLLPWPAAVELEPTTEGYEQMAKFREFLPVKLINVDLGSEKVVARAVGPPTTQQTISSPPDTILSGGIEQSTQS